ncbi:MAG: winged helix-turn-helix transcriptional regulator [Alphaproteobacteria bacterium]|nr:winged helix-turn-helix transcriptional regulator [Alphaproteobacteria bacterium]
MPDGKSGASSAGHLELEHFLPYRLSVLTNRVSAALAREYQSTFGLSVPEWRVMAVLGRFGPAAATRICERTAMDKVTVSRATKSMQSRDLMTARIDADDRRRTIFALTRAGQRIHDEIVPFALAHEAELLAALEPSEVEQLDRLLTKLQTCADKLKAR